jgi:hypothetical protein
MHAQHNWPSNHSTDSASLTRVTGQSHEDTSAADVFKMLEELRDEAPEAFGPGPWPEADEDGTIWWLHEDGTRTREREPVKSPGVE